MTVNEIENRLAELEARARALEPDPAQRDELFTKVRRYAEAFLDRIDDGPTYLATEDQGIGLYDSPISEQGISLDEVLRLLAEHVDRPGLNPASGGHMGYVPGGGIPLSAFGDFLADITNRYSGVFFANPGAVRMENMLLRWMADLVGYPKEAAGNLTSGGSVGNLIGVVAAREAHDLKAGDFSRSVIYLSEQVHHSVNKAIRIAGLKECPVRYVPLDARYRMRADALDALIAQDKRAGQHPWLVVASAGTTDTGAVDPLAEIAEVAREHGLWFHVDGAYGAFFALCEAGRRILHGMERSDSVVMDPHKGLFLPYGTGAVLVREPQHLLKSHHYMPNYFQDMVEAPDELSPADLSPELTKHFRGLRLWLPLKLLGVAPFRACLEEKLLLARYFYQKIQDIDGFEVGPPPDLSVVTYRYLPARGNADDFNRRLVEAIHQDGRVFISSTVLDGKFTLRLAALAFRTHRSTVDLLLEILEEKARWLESK